MYAHPDNHRFNYRHYASLPNGAAVNKLRVFIKIVGRGWRLRKLLFQDTWVVEAWRQSWRLIGQVDLFAAKKKTLQTVLLEKLTLTDERRIAFVVIFMSQYSWPGFLGGNGNRRRRRIMIILREIKKSSWWDGKNHGGKSMRN